MRVSSSRLVAVVFLAISAFWADVSRAALSVQTIDYASGEMTFTLKVPTQAIDADPRSFCRMDVTVLGAEYPFASGDQVFVAVYVDDSYWTTDSAVFSSTFSVTSQEATAQRVQRTIDCTGDFGTTGMSSVAIYGFVDAGKGAFWNPDRGGSNTLTVSVVGDDTPDNDDSAASATQLGAGVTNRVAADADWYAFTVAGSGSIALTLAHDGGSGALDFVLADSGGAQLATGTKTAEGAVINRSGLAAGTYKVKVAPHAANDPNFYDLRPTGTGGGGEGGGGTCTGTGSEQRTCGKCGTQSRTCTSGTWSTWGTCGGQGTCSPGETDIEACGTNKSRTLTCSDTCDWEQGECVSGTGGGGGGTGGGGSSSGSNAGKVGLACQDNAPCGGLECAGHGQTDGMFQNGYCTMSDCTADSSCGDSAALCGGLFGETFCLKRCTDSTDCRTSYICARFGNARACAPRCRDKDDCADNSLPVCDVDSGLCLSSATADPMSWNGARPNADSALSGAALEAGGGCAELGADAWTAIIAIMLLAAHLTARRVARKMSRAVPR